MRAKKKWFTNGGRNLVILGVVSIVVSIATTGVSLAIYHNTGDIYRDRSRPGYLPDEQEIEEENEKQEEYVFEKSGKLTIDIIEEYLEKLKIEVREVDAYDKPFNEDALSDERLGIPAPEQAEDNHN